MRVIALVSGGKDSLYAAYAAGRQGHELACLGTVLPSSPESYMFHHPNIGLTKTIAVAAGMPLLTRNTKGVKEDELKDLEELLKDAKQKHKVEGVVSGALASEYQKTRIEKLCKKLRLKSIAPLWRREPEALLREMTAEGFEVIITAVAAEGLGREWLGRKLDEKAIDELVALSKKHGIHTGGEGGEYETLVLDCPLFNKRLVVKKAVKEWDGATGVYAVKEAELA